MEKPTLPKGTRDFGPAVMAKRQFIFNTIRQVFQTYGFMPLETPAMENLSTLTGKYGEEGDQLLFKILNSGDFLGDVDPTLLAERQSKKITGEISKKGLRYDLTVPFARYVVMNRNEISFPFKRYQMQPVWRGDRPQKGRYCEFYQCDADVIGTNSLLCEAEIILMIKEVFKGLGIPDYSIKINHRGILSAIAEIVNAKSNENATLPIQGETSLFVAIDKLDKIGVEKVKEELRPKGYSDESLNILFDILEVKGSTTNKIAFLVDRFTANETGQQGLRDLREVLNFLKSYNADDTHVEFDIALARGLSYYTGCIFEVKINNVGIGSVSGGGRYDNLTKAFGDKENLSGVGFSFGVDRIYDAMEELQLFPKNAQISSKVLICHFDDASLQYGLGVLARLRAAGIPAEIYPDQKKLNKQLEYANKKMIPFTLVIGSDEMQSGQLAFKDMEKGEQVKATVDEVIAKLR
ncbi:histidine--tRNA ligase [Parachryseolinea silvisoli]|uniref:histidine--tRNA ligase n=1 Tax=Parachryseolinea silvisoli TaxID=2873601 RepID=UPI00226592E2|nr:histidine--tRNA ligase [Parachryseolinea silvisoli]MCD9014505.1 histidine--tRNA ligase [Parachryseolinea silvisoli]